MVSRTVLACRLHALRQGQVPPVLDVVEELAGRTTTIDHARLQEGVVDILTPPPGSDPDEVADFNADAAMSCWPLIYSMDVAGWFHEPMRN